MGGQLTVVRRRPDWQSRLSACVQAALGTPFEWGRFDCALFAADAIHAMTDVDLAQGFRGRYSTATGASRILRRAGYSDHVDLAVASLPEIASAYATDGDVGLVETAAGLTLGLYSGEMIAAPGPAGLTFLPRTEAGRAFRVPFDVGAD